MGNTGVKIGTRKLSRTNKGHWENILHMLTLSIITFECQGMQSRFFTHCIHHEFVHPLRCSFSKAC